MSKDSKRMPTRLLLRLHAQDCDQAMQTALAIVNNADTERKNIELREKIIQMCDDLFKSIGLQTSVREI